MILVDVDEKILYDMENICLGMTINERLYVNGLINEFEKAVREKDVEKVRFILNKIDIRDNESIEVFYDNKG